MLVFDLDSSHPGGAHDSGNTLIPHRRPEDPSILPLNIIAPGMPPSFAKQYVLTSLIEDNRSAKQALRNTKWGRLLGN